MFSGGQKLSIENLWGATIQIGVFARQLKISKGAKILQSPFVPPPPLNEALYRDVEEGQ